MVFIHLFFIVMMMLLFCFYGYKPTLSWLSLIYYLFCLFALINGMSLIASALNPFVKDISQLVGIIIQFGFWLTPIFWNIKSVPLNYQFIFEFNPMYYIISGYRGALLDDQLFWNEPIKVTLFLTFILILNFIGFKVFNNVKAHFPDVL